MGGRTLEMQGKNATDNLNQIKKQKLREASQEVKTKRVALGVLQNRCLTRDIAAKDAAQKDIKDLKAKSRVDTHVKKEPLGTTANGSLSKKFEGFQDIDANDKRNLFLVSEYVNEIYDYLYQVEKQQPIFKDHLAGQRSVSPKMRAVLIDWINAVNLQFHLTADSFQLAVAIIDRYLQVVKDTKRNYFQLVGVTALFIATKYERLCPVGIETFVYVSDDTYTARQIRQMELQILKAIDFSLSRPLPIHFLRRYSKAAGATNEQHVMAKYFIELAALTYDLASYRPSEIAAASMFLSLNLLNGNHREATGFNDQHWSATLSFYSRYSASDLRPISRKIAKLARNAPQAKLKAVYIKYQGSNFHKIAQRRELSSPLIDYIIGQNFRK
ncbi:G2/mitotic-specific cyclin-B-like [Drosophila kikkawai]|uniref:G2/mitotic-specific cyclin-B-like n=1 Tax=Drosophila kikkawai TaxID=30033 RepID=A0A6P4I9A4_DROKI|nr:G2/mitotic-specific cyclin-B-like [Drosophila kikkawai]